MMERRRADRKAEYDPVDIVYPRDKYIFTSSFVSKALAFTVKRKVHILYDFDFKVFCIVHCE